MKPRSLQSFRRVGRIVAATRRRTARELWDLLSPTDLSLAAATSQKVSGSKVFTQRLAAERPPGRSAKTKALQFDRFGAIITFMYVFYLAVVLMITLPVLLVAFLLDGAGWIRVRFGRARLS
ncbi:MAG TPA: hypothetical protein VFW40_01000 [Capsulimonadaceae bacterium]|nr:hypothetical protein [Capsulimonadaceae bacterium]